MLDQTDESRAMTKAERQAAERKALHPQEHEGGWTDNRIAELTRLWSEGLSAHEIAMTLGGGLTRNAVLGKVHRLALPKRLTLKFAVPKPKVHGNRGQPKANAIVARAAQRRADAAKPARAQRMAEPVETPFDDGDTDGVDVTHLVGIMGLTKDRCKWPVGDPKVKGFGFCGRPAVEDKPYCEHHCGRAYAGPTAAQVLARQK